MMIVDKIHETPYRTVIAVTGGGTEVIGRLLRRGNGSATLIEAVVPYSTDAMDNWLGGKPDKYCSPVTARAMAMRAYQHAVHLTDGSYPIVGIGATCKLAKGGPERKGRTHEIYVAAQNSEKTLLATLELKYPRKRQDEEDIAAIVILNVLARSCGVPENVLPIYPDFKEELIIVESQVDPLVQAVVSGRTQVARITYGERHDTRIVFPGSFNPLHKNHKAMARYAYEKYGSQVDFEISVENVDKPALDYITIEERLAQFREVANEPWMGDVYLTHAPLFAQKADLFPGCTFLVGYDTFVRISNPKYYLPHEFEPTIESLKQKGVRFVAFHRVNAEVVVTPELFALADIVSPEAYTDDGTSSTKIREMQCTSTAQIS